METTILGFRVHERYRVLEIIALATPRQSRPEQPSTL